jgi:hypothetical protein
VTRAKARCAQLEVVVCSLKRVTQKNDDATLKHKTQDCLLWRKELLCSSIVLLYLILTISKIIKNKYVVKRAGDYGFTGLGSTSRTTCAPREPGAAANTQARAGGMPLVCPLPLPVWGATPQKAMLRRYSTSLKRL